MQFPYDQLKQILRDVFALVGPADTEVEVPPGDAARFDIWHTPDPALLSAHPEIGPGVLGDIAAEQGAVARGPQRRMTRHKAGPGSSTSAWEPTTRPSS